MRALAGVALLAWLAIYLPDAGRGFIKDDWAWLLAAPLSPSPWDAAWTASTGFFRPLVSLSFTANHALFNLNPLGYGLTNMALALSCAALIFLLARSWGLETSGAAVAAGIWLFTPHGMDMAVIWISGRSALMLALFTVSACWAASRGRMLLAGACLAAALLSKDEAVVVPVLGLISIAASGRLRDRRITGTWIVLSAVLLAGYFWMRAASGAHTPSSAPAEYMFVTTAPALLQNTGQYLDRLVTFPLVVCAAFWLVTRGAAGQSANLVRLAAAWAATAIAPTIALPVRSSLYVLLPLVGTAMLAAALIDARLRVIDERARWRVVVAFAAIAIAAVPIYRMRQRDWSDAARLSAAVTADVVRTLRDVPEGAALHVQDRVDHPNLESTFGNLLPEMLQVATGKRFELVHASQRGTSILFAPVPR